MTGKTSEAEELNALFSMRPTRADILHVILSIASMQKNIPSMEPNTVWNVMTKFEELPSLQKNLNLKRSGWKKK